MIEGRWVRISTLHRSTLGDNLTFYLPELLCHICHWMYSTASYWALSVVFFLPLRTDCSCMYDPSAPSSEMHWGVLFSKAGLPSWGPAVAPLMPTLPPSLWLFQVGAHRKTAWPCEAATLSFRTRCRCRSYLSSRQLPLIWTYPRTLTEVGPPWRGTVYFPETVDPCVPGCLLGIHPQEAPGP